jgi:transketolase
MNEAAKIDARRLASQIRIKALKLTSETGSSHIGSCLSIADILGVYYSMNLHLNSELILSKGHAVVAQLAALNEIREIDDELFSTFGKNGSLLISHVSHMTPGVRVSTGSLGHGLPIGIGLALAERQKRIFVICSDGELNEGTTWESLMLGRKFNLENLIVILDQNKWQSLGRTKEIIDLNPLVEKIRAFGWNIIEIDGHNIVQISDALSTKSKGSPTFIIADTIKGKGIKIMEDKLEWHYKSPRSEDLEDFILEIETHA